MFVNSFINYYRNKIVNNKIGLWNKHLIIAEMIRPRISDFGENYHLFFIFLLLVSQILYWKYFHVKKQTNKNKTTTKKHEDSCFHWVTLTQIVIYKMQKSTLCVADLQFICRKTTLVTRSSSLMPRAYHHHGTVIHSLYERTELFVALGGWIVLKLTLHVWTQFVLVQTFFSCNCFF